MKNELEHFQEMRTVSPLPELHVFSALKLLPSRRHVSASPFLCQISLTLYYVKTWQYLAERDEKQSNLHLYFSEKSWGIIEENNALVLKLGSGTRRPHVLVEQPRQPGANDYHEIVTPLGRGTGLSVSFPVLVLTWLEGTHTDPQPREEWHSFI